MSEQLYRVVNERMKHFGATYRLAWASLLTDEVLVPVEPCIHGNIDPHEYTEPCGEWHEDTPLGCEVPTIKDCPGSPTLNNDQT